MLPKLTDLVRGKQAKLTKITDRQIWYQILYVELVPDGDLTIFDFPIPFDDIGSATLGTMEPAMQLLKWVRKQHELLTQAQTEMAKEAE